MLLIAVITLALIVVCLIGAVIKLDYHFDEIEYKRRVTYAEVDSTIARLESAERHEKRAYDELYESHQYTRAALDALVAYHGLMAVVPSPDNVPKVIITAKL